MMIMAKGAECRRPSYRLLSGCFRMTLCSQLARNILFTGFATRALLSFDYPLFHGRLSFIARSPFPQILFVHSVWCLSGRVVVVGKTRRKDAILVARVFIMEIRLFEPQTGFLSSPPPVDNNNNTREGAGIESE